MNIISGVFRGIAVFSTLYDVKKTVESDELTTKEKVIRAGSGAIFVLAQGADVGLGQAHHFTDRSVTDFQFAVRTISGVAGVVHGVSKFDFKKEHTTSEYLVLVGGVVFQMTCSLDSAITLYPEAFRMSILSGRVTLTPELCDQLVDSINAVAGVLMCADNIAAAPRNARDLGNALARIYRKCFEKAMNEELKELEPEEAELFGKEYLEGMEEIENAESIDDLRSIPLLFKNDVILKLYKCAISKNPIRKVSILVGTEKQKNPIYFEKSVIETCFIENKRPECWPRRIAFNRVKVKPFVIGQQQINQRLEILLVETKEQLEEIKKMPRAS